MAYAEDLIKLRTRFAEAVALGVVENTESMEAILIQIMNDAERNRQNAVAQAENLRKQISTLDGQAAAFGSTVSTVYNVLSGFIKAAQKAKEEEERMERERLEKEGPPPEETEVQGEPGENEPEPEPVPEPEPEPEQKSSRSKKK